MGCANTREKEFIVKDLTTVDVTTEETVRKTLLLNSVSKNYSISNTESGLETLDSIVKNWEKLSQVKSK